MNAPTPATGQNKQALKSFELQTVDHPSDIRPQALASPIVHLLARMDGGDLVEDANAKLQQLVSNCMIFNKKGEITINLKFAVGGMSRMEIVGKVTAKIPEGESAATSLFSTQDGQLTAYDPNQPQFRQETMPAVEQLAPRQVALPERGTRIIDVPTTTPVAA